MSIDEATAKTLAIAHRLDTSPKTQVRKFYKLDGTLADVQEIRMKITRADGEPFDETLLVVTGERETAIRAEMAKDGYKTLDWLKDK